MLKLIGLLALSATVGAIGFIYCDRLIARKKFLEKLTLFAAACSGTMRYSHRSIFDIFKENGTRELKFLNDLDKYTITDRTAVSEILISCGVNALDRAVVTEFIIGLSEGDIKELSNHCECYKLKFQQMHSEAQKDASERGRLFRTLFVLVGFALFIILI